MSTKYKETRTCDKCGFSETVKSDFEHFSHGWSELRIDRRKFDLCQKCSAWHDKVIEDTNRLFMNIQKVEVTEQ